LDVALALEVLRDRRIIAAEGAMGRRCWDMLSGKK
jgi:hypothetical protein